VNNIVIEANGKITLGVHEGVVNGVKLIFLHNADYFPIPYADLKPFD